MSRRHQRSLTTDGCPGIFLSHLCFLQQCSVAILYLTINYFCSFSLKSSFDIKNLFMSPVLVKNPQIANYTPLYFPNNSHVKVDESTSPSPLNVPKSQTGEAKFCAVS